jgi:hypothetical protein
LVGLERGDGTGIPVVLHLYQLRVRASLFAAALSLDCLVCAVADGAFSYATGASTHSIGISFFSPLVLTSHAMLLHFPACLDMASDPKGSAENLLVGKIRRLHSLRGFERNGDLSPITREVAFVLFALPSVAAKRRPP